MNQPAVAPVVDESRRRRRRLVIIVSVVAGLGLMGAGAYGVFSLVSGLIQRAALKPWTILQEAKVAVQTEGGAEAFHKAHPGLTARYPTAASFVQASRPWGSKLAKLPPNAPDFWMLIKNGGGNLNVNSSNSRTTFSLTGFRGVSIEVVLDSDQLVDLQVE